MDPKKLKAQAQAEEGKVVAFVKAHPVYAAFAALAVILLLIALLA